MIRVSISRPRQRKIGRLAALGLLLLAPAAPTVVIAAGGFHDYRTILVSHEDGREGIPANGNSSEPSVSLDAQRISFVSSAPDLDPRSSTAEVMDYSLGSGRTELVSRANGTHGAAADGNSSAPSSSGSGQIVAFVSTAGNLGGRPGVENVYVRNLKKGTTTLVSRAAGAAGAKGDGNSFAPSISADGTKVAFASEASNLGGGADTQIYVRDLGSEQTVLVSRAGAGQPGNGDSTEPAISSSGNAVAFASEAANLGAGGTAGQQVFERKLGGGDAVLVSRAPGRGGADADAAAGEPSIDGFGDRVAFASAATNLSPLARPVENVYLRDLPGGETELISRSGGRRGVAGNGDSSRPDLPRDGRFVCFESVATDLGNRYDGFGVDTKVENVYVHDTLHHGTFLISRRPGRYAAGGNGDSANVSCSAGASYAAFQSVATNLDGAIDPGLSQIYRRTIFGGR